MVLLIYMDFHKEQLTIPEKPNNGVEDAGAFVKPNIDPFADHNVEDVNRVKEIMTEVHGDEAEKSAERNQH